MNTKSMICAAAAMGALSVPLAAPALADAPPGVKGQPNATEPKIQGAPTSSNGLVSVFSHTLKDSGSSLGQHSSSFAPGQNKDPGQTSATGRVGVGNLARTDGLPGDTANSHFTGQLVIGMNDPAAANLPPGNNDNPKRGNPNAP